MTKKKNFIEHSLLGVLTFLKECIFADEFAKKRAFLQSLDPRVKTVTIIFFIIQVLLIKDIYLVLCRYGLCLLLVVISKIPLGFFLKRTWIFIPLFSLFIAIPAIFEIFTPGIPLVTLKILGARLIITQPGLFGAALFITRVITCVSFVVLLSVTTKHFELLKVLRILKVPQVFVMTIGMCYRYIYLFLEIIENTYLAIKSRSGVRMNYKKGQHVVSWNIAYLWQRSYRLNEDVYKAMLSRGYRGEPLILQELKLNPIDWLWLMLVLIISIPLFYLNYRVTS